MLISSLRFIFVIIGQKVHAVDQNLSKILPIFAQFGEKLSISQMFLVHNKIIVLNLKVLNFKSTILLHKIFGEIIDF